MEWTVPCAHFNYELLCQVESKQENKFCEVVQYRDYIICRTSYRGAGRANTGKGETPWRLLMAGICPALGWKYKGKR